MTANGDTIKQPRRRRNERVAVTLSPESLATLTEISELLGRPKSALISDLVDQTLPAMVTTLNALRVVRDQPREAARLIKEFTASTVAKVGQAQLDFDEHLDKRTVKGRRRKTVA